MNKKHVTLIVIIVLLSIVLVIGGTYAFFLANVSGNDDAELIKITAGDFELTFTDSSGIYFDNYIRPGTSASKTFTVQNTGTADDAYTYTYNIKLTQLSVTYEKQDLVYTLQEYTNDQYTELKPDGVNETGYINKNTVNADGEMYLAINIERPPKGEFHYYKLTIEFKKLDNVNQNYNQGKVFGGKINVDDNRDALLYDVLQEHPFYTTMVKNKEEIANDDPDKNIRYIGQDPSNYIWFNCNNYSLVTDQTSATEQECEKWRIIGLFKDIQKPDGSSEDLVKIIRADRLGDIEWDSERNNNWANASLQISLNTTYYNGTKLSKGEGIKDSTREMIELVTWNIGGHTTNFATAQQFYEYERGNVIPGDEKSTWDGYIGLIYPSDYGYATSGLKDDQTYNREVCLAYSLGNWDSENYKKNCAKNDWLIFGSAQWTIAQYSSNSSQVFVVSNVGYINYVTASTAFVIRPTLYLKSNVKIVGGEGTFDEPYILQQGE